MNIKQIYKIQLNNEINVRNGYTQKESWIADEWIIKFGCLAAFLGWNHVVDPHADEDSEIFTKIKNLAQNNYEYHNLTAWYEIAGLVAEFGTPVKMEA